MNTTLIQNQAKVADVCRAFGVTRLDVFGSAADGRFDPTRSDYDFVARFAPSPEASMARRFIGFSEALEELLGRPVDLMTDHEVANPYLRAAIDATRTNVYAEPVAEAFV
jgi:hypothetical protein